MATNASDTFAIDGERTPDEVWADIREAVDTRVE